MFLIGVREKEERKIGKRRRWSMFPSPFIIFYFFFSNQGGMGEGRAPLLSVLTHVYCGRWGVDMSNSVRGGTEGVLGQPLPSFRDIHLMQRKSSKVGKGLGKTTGWIHRRTLELRGVKSYAGVTYKRFDNDGFHVTIDGKDVLLDVDNVVICAGQLSLKYVPRRYRCQRAKA